MLCENVVPDPEPASGLRSYRNAQRPPCNGWVDVIGLVNFTLGADSPVPQALSAESEPLAHRLRTSGPWKNNLRVHWNRQS
jgi:hypothetical protein